MIPFLWRLLRLDWLWKFLFGDWLVKRVWGEEDGEHGESKRDE
jgi:hypothetical protein